MLTTSPGPGVAALAVSCRMATVLPPTLPTSNSCISPGMAYQSAPLSVDSLLIERRVPASPDPQVITAASDVAEPWSATSVHDAGSDVAAMIWPTGAQVTA